MTRQAAMALMYACGATMQDVADWFFVTYNTVHTHIGRARLEYRDLGIDAGTKILLLQAIENDYRN